VIDNEPSRALGGGATVNRSSSLCPFLGFSASLNAHRRMTERGVAGRFRSLVRVPDES